MTENRFYRAVNSGNMFDLRVYRLVAEIAEGDTWLIQRIDEEGEPTGKVFPMDVYADGTLHTTPDDAAQYFIEWVIRNIDQLEQRLETYRGLLEQAEAYQAGLPEVPEALPEGTEGRD